MSERESNLKSFTVEANGVDQRRSDTAVEMNSHQIIEGVIPFDDRKLRSFGKRAMGHIRDEFLQDQAIITIFPAPGNKILIQTRAGLFLE